MRPHQKLDLWKRAIEFVVAINKITERFPKEEKFGLTSQLRRAAVSIVANIAEGAARTSPREFLQFLSHSQGSAREVDTELVIALRLGYLVEKEYLELSRDLDDIGKMITRLSQGIRRKQLLP
ncbi:MAG TPA: four helix bundle protein [Pyrinomonadaceae bacterium]|nr:four helix bundle protein [Pyrinomonadaceae bacterium]